jgi:hypothetical protein
MIRDGSELKELFAWIIGFILNFSHFLINEDKNIIKLKSKRPGSFQK